MANWLTDFLGSDKAAAALAGALGGVVRWITLKEKPRDGAASVVVGAICAVFLGPVVQPAITPLIGSFVVEEASRQAFGGFTIGLAGIAISGFLIDFVRNWTNRSTTQLPPVAPVMPPAPPAPKPGDPTK